MVSVVPGLVEVVVAGDGAVVAVTAGREVFVAFGAVVVEVADRRVVVVVDASAVVVAALLSVAGLVAGAPSVVCVSLEFDAATDTAGLSP